MFVLVPAAFSRGAPGVLGGQRNGRERDSRSASRLQHILGHGGMHDLSGTLAAVVVVVYACGRRSRRIFFSLSFAIIAVFAVSGSTINMFYFVFFSRNTKERKQLCVLQCRYSPKIECRLQPENECIPRRPLNGPVATGSHKVHAK